MKNENPLHTFESWRQEKELYSLMESADLLIEESKSEKSDISSFEDMTDEELEEACERECQAFLEDTSFYEDDNKLEEDKATAVAAGAVAATTAAVGAHAGSYAVAGLLVAGSPTFSVAAAIAAAGPVGLAVGAVAGAGLLIYRLFSKRKQLKIALKGLEPGTAKYDAMKKKMKALSLSELKEYNKIKETKAYTKAIKDGIKGNSNPPKDPELKGAYDEGFKKGEAAKKEAEEIKKLPKEEQKEKLKEIQGKAKGVEAKGEKLKATAKKIKELKK